MGEQYVLGISAFYHDSAAALLCDGKVIAAVHEERFTRIKHTEAFPENAIRFCLEKAGIKPSQLSAVAFYEKPFLKFERILESYYNIAPKGLFSWLHSIPIWAGGKLNQKKTILKELRKIEGKKNKLPQLLFPEHHLSHQASSFFVSPFQESAIVTLDGVGEWATAVISHGSGNKITKIKQLNYPHSVGLLYSAFTHFLGFKVNSGEYKLMGLAPYGEIDDQTKTYIDKIKTELVTIYDDGSIWLNLQYFKFQSSLKMTNDKKWLSLFGVEKRKPKDELLQIHCNLALACQTVIEEIVLKIIAHAAELTGSKNLCLAGGVALNCVANEKIQSSQLFDNIYIQPASGDAGGALGAALATHYIHHKIARTATKSDKINYTYLGPSYTDHEICETLINNGIEFSILEESVLNTHVASIIASGKVVGWFNDKAEYGPRALGNRSILADARYDSMQSTLNQKIKFREGFRPFAPVVLENHAGQFFTEASPSPFMLYTTQISSNWRIQKPENFDQLSPADKIKIPLSNLPAITHMDYSARVQTVSKESNKQLYDLITAYTAKTGVPVLVNTSFNLRGEPMVLDPKDAFKCFMKSGIDVLVYNSRILVSKENQSESVFLKYKNFELLED